MNKTDFTGHKAPDFVEARVCFAVVCRGPYRRFLEVCADLEDLPDVRLIYRRASPNYLFIVEKGVQGEEGDE